MIRKWIIAVTLLHACGALGGVNISMTRPIDWDTNEACLIEQPFTDQPDVYRVRCSDKPIDEGTWRAGYELWSDWPECGGSLLN